MTGNITIRQDTCTITLCLPRLIDLPVKNIRKLFAMMLSDPQTNEDAIQTLGYYLEEAVATSKTRWDVASSTYQKEWRLIEKPTGRRTRKYQENLRAKGPDIKLGNDHAFAEFVERRIIDDGYSPGAVLAEIRENGLFDTDICESTLYNYIYRGDVFLELAPKHLHEQGRRHQIKGGSKQAARAPKGESIERRPAEIDDRTTFGHWELDSVMGTVGSNRALLVFTERLTRAGIIIPVPDHTAASTVRAINRLERKMGALFYKVFKSITVDNGCEFQDYAGMEKACRRKGKRTTVYYCHPYAPHERGSNENMNRIIRRFFPKGTNFDEVDLDDIRKAEDWINSYPRKVLGWKSAGALMREYIAA